jgi:hypothetical protein
MRFLALALAIFTASAAYADEILTISSDKAEYLVGEVPELQASVVTRPLSPDFEFDVVGELNEQPLPVERVSDFEFSSTAPGLSAGSYTWDVTLVIQDKRYARDLKASITYFDGQIDTIEDQLLTETDPGVIEQLEAEKARFESLKAAAESELVAIRTVVKAAHIDFTVQTVQ